MKFKELHKGAIPVSNQNIQRPFNRLDDAFVSHLERIMNRQDADPIKERLLDVMTDIHQTIESRESDRMQREFDQAAAEAWADEAH